MAYSATLTFTAHTDDPDTAGENLAEQLAGAVGYPSSGSLDWPYWTASWTIPTATVRQAAAAAVTAGTEAIRAAGFTRLTITAIEVLDDDLAERALNSPSVPELVDYSWIAEQQGFSRQRARQIATEHDDFPPAVGPGPVFVRAAVERWFTRERRPGRPKKEGSADV